MTLLAPGDGGGAASILPGNRDRPGPDGGGPSGPGDRFPAASGAAVGVLGETARIGGERAVEPGGMGGVDDDFVDCYRRHYPRVVRALELAGSSRPTAEDVAQEAFARTFGHWRRVRTGTNPAGYVYRTAFRLARRQGRVALRGGEDEDLVADRRAGDLADEATTRTSLLASIAAMPPARRACAVLCLLADVSTKDAARSLGIRESTVRKQIERARADMRRALDTSRPAPAVGTPAPAVEPGIGAGAGPGALQ